MSSPHTPLRMGLAMRSCWSWSLSQLSCAPVRARHAPLVLVSGVADIGAGIEVAVAATNMSLGQLRKFFRMEIAFVERRMYQQAGVATIKRECLRALASGLKEVQSTVFNKVLCTSQEAKAHDAQLIG